MKKFLIVQLFIVLFAQMAQCDDKVYSIVPKMPDFPGGTEALLRWEEENMLPISVCQKEKVVAQFVVYENGSIGQVNILRASSNPECNQEVLRLINTMPRWKPGELADGTKVRVKVSYPFVFPSRYKITQNGSILYGALEGCANDVTWELNKKTQTLSISGPGDIIWDKSWENVQTLKLAADVKSISFIGRLLLLKNIYVDTNNPSYASIKGVLTNKEKTVLFKYPAGRKNQNYRIPASIQTIESFSSIGGGAFALARIDTLFIPSGVTNINQYSFQSAKIKCIKVINNPLYTVVQNNILCKADQIYTVYYLPNPEKVPFISAQQFYKEVIEIASVSSSQKDIFKSTKPTVIVLSWEYAGCASCKQIAEKLKVFAALYKDKVNFYQIDIHIVTSENRAIKDYYSKVTSCVPTILAVNGVYQGDLTYFAYSSGDDNLDWLQARIEEMLAGKRNKR